MCGFVDNLFGSFKNVISTVASIASFVPGPWQIPAMMIGGITQLAQDNPLGAGLSFLGGTGALGGIADAIGLGDTSSGLLGTLSDSASGSGGALANIGAGAPSGLSDMFNVNQGAMRLPSIGGGSSITAADVFNQFPEQMAGFSGPTVSGGLNATIGGLGGGLGDLYSDGLSGGGSLVSGPNLADSLSQTVNNMGIQDTLPMTSVTPGNSNFGDTLQNLFTQASELANSPYGKLLGGVGKGVGAYLDYRGTRDAQKALGGQLERLDQLYSPDSPYAKQMEKTLARRDAARGRRSQYGVRAQELASNLTQNQANVWSSPQYLQALTASRQSAVPWGSVFGAGQSILSGLGGLFK